MPIPSRLTDIELRDLLRQVFPTGLFPYVGATTLGGWVCVQSQPNPLWWKANCGVKPAWDLEVERQQGDMLPLPDQRARATWVALLGILANEVGWGFKSNLSWWAIWPGGWCLHGRQATSAAGVDQDSITVSLPEEITQPEEALVRSILKVREAKTKGPVKWFCKAHNWAVIAPRGRALSGCPECGMYECEDA